VHSGNIYNIGLRYTPETYTVSSTESIILKNHHFLYLSAGAVPWCTGLVKGLFQDVSTEWGYSLNRKNTLSDWLLSFNVLCNCLYFIVIIFCTVCKESENEAIIL